MKINSKALVVQANHIIEARYKLSLEEQRLIKILISMIDERDEDTKIYRIKATDVASILEITDDHIYHTLKQVTAKLIKQVLFIKREGGELQVSWLSSAEYLNGGIIELEISQKLRPYLLQLKEHFTKYQLKQIARLKSGFSIRVYELCKCYEYRGGFLIKVDNLKKMFGLEDKYKLYGDLKRYVLLVAKAEINETTDIVIDFLEIKEGKRVDSIQFVISPRNQEAQVTGSPEITIAKLDKTENPTIARLVSLGVSQKAAEELAGNYGEARINDALTYTLHQQKENKLKNPAGFLVKAIENGYRDFQAEEQDRKKAARKALAAKEAKAKALQVQTVEAKKQVIDRFLASLTQDQLVELQAEFIEQSKDNLALMNSFKKKGMDSSMVKGCFRDYIYKHKLNFQ